MSLPSAPPILRLLQVLLREVQFLWQGTADAETRRAQLLAAHEVVATARTMYWTLTDAAEAFGVPIAERRALWALDAYARRLAEACHRSYPRYILSVESCGVCRVLDRLSPLGFAPVARYSGERAYERAQYEIVRLDQEFLQRDLRRRVGRQKPVTRRPRRSRSRLSVGAAAR